MKYPKFLQEKGTITFVAPSYGCAIEPYRSGFENAQRKWREEGFSLEFGPNCYAAEGVGISNTPEKCGEELTEYYCRTTSDCIISCGGGELMCEILDYVNFDRIKNATPKWYMGYSDNTNMTFLLATLCDTAAIYGPCAAAFGMEPRHSSLEDAMMLLQGRKLTMRGYDRWEKESLKDAEHPLMPYNLTETSVIKYILPDGRTNIESLTGVTERRRGYAALEIGRGDGANIKDTYVVEYKSDVIDRKRSTSAEKDPSGNDNEKKEEHVLDNVGYGSGFIDFEGRLLGGCMDCLVTLLGTKYDKVTEFVERYSEDGILWFLESCDLNLMSIRRAMWQMEHAGWFKHCKGFLIGRPRTGMGEEEFGIDHYRAVYEMLEQYHVPVMMDVDIGHLPPMMPLICGSMARVVSDGNTYRVDMELK